MSSLIAPAFTPSSSFAGIKDGMVFKMGSSGLGYYSDEAPQKSSIAQPPSAATGEALTRASFAEPPRPFAPGIRVCDQYGFVATVRYVGPVKSAKKKGETFVGLEWDDPSRG